MKQQRWRFKNRILFWILLPVLGVGIFISGITISFLTPPLVSILQNHIDANLKLASRLGITFCENSMNYLLDLRLENNAEMNKALKRETISEIKGISRQLHKIHTMVIEDNRIVGSSFPISAQYWKHRRFEIDDGQISSRSIGGEPIRTHHLYFPFWNWTVVSFILETDYKAPIQLAKNLVYLATLGVLVLVLLTLYGVFIFFVNRPLKRVINATRGVAEGEFKKIDFKRKDEIGQLVLSFNFMVDSLKKRDADVKNLVEAVKTSEYRFRALFENSPMGILLAEVDGRVLEVNDTMLDLLGYLKSEISQINMKDFYDSPLEHEILLKRLQVEETVRNFEVELKRRDQTIYNARLTVSWYPLGDKNVILTVAEDVTKEKHLEIQLQRAQKMEAIGTLAGGIAHDLNNILSVIVSYAELRLYDLPQKSPLRRPIETIQNSGEKAAAIVQDLLTLARRGVAVKEIVNLYDVVSEYVKSPELKKLQSYHQKTRIQTHLDPDLLNIMGSPIHLTKTVMNLVSNAAEAMIDGGDVVITLENRYIDKPIRGYEEVKEGDYAVLGVTDSGIGISRQDMFQIFEPFYTKKVMGRSGTGLGMAVVWGAVKDHDGYIDVRSVVGKGTTFTLYFPVTRKVVEQERSTVSIEDYLGDGETILVVDDVREQREIATGMLNKLGYSATSVSSGEEAVEFIKSKRVDLIVLDMIMEPGMNGRKTYERILQFHPGQKAVIASGFSETEDVRASQELGAGQYIKKPYSLQKIGLAVKTELRK